MMDDERWRALTLILHDVEALLRTLHELHEADRADSTRLGQLAIAALAGSVTTLTLLAGAGIEIALVPAALVGTGVAGLAGAAVLFATSHIETGRREGLGFGNLPGRYLRWANEDTASDLGVLDGMLRDKAALALENAIIVWRRRERRDRALMLAIGSSLVVLSGLAFIAGGVLFA